MLDKVVFEVQLKSSQPNCDLLNTVLVKLY